MLRGGGLPQIKDVSYIKPPSDRFTVWRNYMNDSFNTTTPMQTTTQAIPEAQARQMGYLPPVPTVPLALPAPPPPPPALPAPPPQPALTNALPQLFLQYMAQQEERNKDREKTVLEMFRNRNNENMGFNSDGRINELPEEEEEQLNQDLRNEGVTQQQLDFLELQKLKNKIKTDRGLGTKDANNNRNIRIGYEDNEYYMSSYNIARKRRENASKTTTRSDTAGGAGAAGARPTTPTRRGPVPGRSPGKNDRLTQEEREAGAATISRLERELANAASLQQAFESFGRGL